MSSPRLDARAIWQAAVDAARPEVLVRAALEDPAIPIRRLLASARRILVVGGGKAGAAMAAGLEDGLADHLDRVEGLLNVPAECVRPLRSLQLHAGRPAGINFPTAEGVAGTARMLDLLAGAGPDDVALCLLSGGGSALLPGPVEGVSLEDKQKVTQLLHASGATIDEMNCVRKHLSRVKGGGLARTFTGKALVSLIISDVVGDPLDVIASGPTAADPTTFADAVDVLHRYGLFERTPSALRQHLGAGASGSVAETLKQLPATVTNHVIGNNALALDAARAEAERRGYPVLNLGSFIEGETRQVAAALAGVVRSIRQDGIPARPPLCLLSGGETTVTLCDAPGRGGRNQEFVLAVALRLGGDGLRDTVVLSGGTDGEDGPTDAAGAWIDAESWQRAAQLALSPARHLARCDAYPVFHAIDSLLITGLTHTNVMDVRVVLLV